MTTPKRPQASKVQAKEALPLLYKGCSGNAVKILQQQLNEKGFLVEATGSLIVDGEFGIKTERAVKGFQSICQLTVDGIVGPETWQQLGQEWNYPD